MVKRPKRRLIIKTATPPRERESNRKALAVLGEGKTKSKRGGCGCGRKAARKS